MSHPIFQGENLLFSSVCCPFQPLLFSPVIFTHCRVCILICRWSNGVHPANTGSQRNLCTLGFGVPLLAPSSLHFSARAIVCKSIRVCRMLKFGAFGVKCKNMSVLTFTRGFLSPLFLFTHSAPSGKQNLTHTHCFPLVVR